MPYLDTELNISFLTDQERFAIEYMRSIKLGVMQATGLIIDQLVYPGCGPDLPSMLPFPSVVAVDLQPFNEQAQPIIDAGSLHEWCRYENVDIASGLLTFAEAVAARINLRRNANRNYPGSYDLHVNSKTYPLNTIHFVKKQLLNCDCEVPIPEEKRDLSSILLIRAGQHLRTTIREANLNIGFRPVAIVCDRDDIDYDATLQKGHKSYYLRNFLREKGYRHYIIESPYKKWGIMHKTNVFIDESQQKQTFSINPQYY